MSEIPEDIMRTAREACNSAFGEWDTAKEEDVYAAIAKAILADRQRDQWQPIETAPKDSQKIDLWATFEKSGSHRVTDCYWNDKVGGWQLGQYNAADYMVAPIITHWIPLPAAPKTPEHPNTPIFHHQV